MTSQYFKQLNSVHQERYRKKLIFNNNDLPDPLDDEIREQVFVDDCTKFPKISVLDIYIYLVETKCHYTREAFKSYKTTEGYNFFISGKVKTILIFAPSALNACLVTAIVEASQTTKKYYRPWAVVEKEGTICSAHCTCMAGLGECCCHVSALLFAIKATVQSDESCTSVECAWKRVKKEVEPKPIIDITFMKPSMSAKGCISTSKQKEVVPKCSKEQFSLFKRQLKACIPNSIAASTVSDSEETLTASEDDSECGSPSNRHVLSVGNHAIPLPPKELYCSSTVDNFSKINLTEDEVNILEKATRRQYSCPLWNEQRKGRITASVVGRILTCKTGQDRLVGELMGYFKNPQSRSLTWGKINEPKAKDKLIDILKTEHDNFQFLECGLRVSPDKPYLGATPDGLVQCACCDDATVEIKCPETLKNCIIKDVSKKSFFLDENLELKETHHYYAQVMCQMALFKVRKAYFVVYTNVDLQICLVKWNQSFWDSALKKIDHFFKNYILKEILERLLENKMCSAIVDCTCKGKTSGSVITCIVCSKSYHLKCVGLKRTCKEWLCHKCP